MNHFVELVIMITVKVRRICRKILYVRFTLDIPIMHEGFILTAFTKYCNIWAYSRP